MRTLTPAAWAASSTCRPDACWRPTQEKTELADRLRLQAEASERQAHEDPLTGLPNRRAFDEGLARDCARSQRRAQPLSLVVLDIDHFKVANDTWSHGVGDQVLCEVAQLLAASCRDSDLPVRLGGEESALQLNDTALEEAQLACMRLQGLFHAQCNWAGIDGLRVTFSAGVVQLGAGDRTPLLLVQRADKALYQAKSDGRDRACLGWWGEERVKRNQERVKAQAPARAVAVAFTRSWFLVPGSCSY